MGGNTSARRQDGMFPWWEVWLRPCFRIRIGGWARRSWYLPCRRDRDEEAFSIWGGGAGGVLLRAESDRCVKARRAGVCEILRHGILPWNQGRAGWRSPAGGPALR